jgi:hypothetical protein
MRVTLGITELVANGAHVPTNESGSQAQIPLPGCPEATYRFSPVNFSDSRSLLRHWSSEQLGCMVRFQQTLLY